VRQGFWPSALTMPLVARTVSPGRARRSASCPTFTPSPSSNVAAGSGSSISSSARSVDSSRPFTRAFSSLPSTKTATSSRSTPPAAVTICFGLQTIPLIARRCPPSTRTTLFPVFSTMVLSDSDSSAMATGMVCGSEGFGEC
jgi:hypothetical protein